MKRSSYRDRDYGFGQTMLTLRSAIGLTQTGLADYLGVSRRAIGDWEAGSSYPKAEHLKKLIILALEQQVFPAGREVDDIRALWQAAHQKVLLDERWLAGLLAHQPTPPPISSTAGVYTNATPAREERQTRGSRNAAGELPFQPTPFIGREAELNEISRILADPACRLLTLLGPGGIGKTRLALAVASARAGIYAGGVAFVALASVGTMSEIVTAIGDALDLSFAGQPDPTAHLLGYLHKRHILLVLDNFEHLLEGVDLVYDILLHAPNVTILVTSRARLNLRAEWLFDVEGLSYPTGDTASAGQNLGAFSEYSAVQLFVQRVTQIQPGIPLPDETLTSIVRICQHVVGMPLAIELAAAAVRVMPVPEIERHIRSNLDVLATTLRDIPARHRSMRAVFEHSWNLLSEQERAQFSRLSVFRGGCTADAAGQVAGAMPAALMSLVDKSLLREIRNAKIGIEPRFVLLESIREYALEQLRARGEAEAVQQAHAVYYLALAEAASRQWGTPTVDSAIARLNTEYDNLRAALQWARDSGYSTLGLQIAGAVWKFWRSYGFISEGRAWLEELLALDDMTAAPASVPIRLSALHAAAWFASDQHDYAQAARLFEQRTALRRTLGQTEADTNLILNAARQARGGGQYQEATTLLESVLEQYRNPNNSAAEFSPYELGQTLRELGLVLREQGEFARAAAMFEEGLQLHRAMGDREGIALALLGLADVARDRGDAAVVRGYGEPSLTVFRELGMQWAVGFALNSLAQGAYEENDLARAYALSSESVALFRNLQADGSIAEVLVTRGHVTRAQGDMAAAQKALTESLRLANIVGPRLLVASALEALATVVSLPEQAVQAVRLLAAAAAMRAQMGTPMRPADQPILNRALASAQSTLGTDTFARLWSEGKEQPDAVLSSVLDAETPDGTLSASSRWFEETRSVVVAPSAPRLDWGEALAVPSFYGREWELALLTEWIVEERCKVVSLLGLGGIGKSSLAVTLMRRLANHFDVVIWRSLRDIPICDVLLEDLLQVLAPQALAEVDTSFEQRLNLLMEQMRSTRILMVLDNVESVLEEGTGFMRPGYEGFGRFLRRSAETGHQSSLLLTSREKPGDLVPHEGSHAPVRALRLARLDADACEQLLAEKEVVGSTADRVRLIESYAGNPLALKIVTQTVIDLFDGEIAPFLEQGEVIFGGVRELLKEQFDRLTPLEQSILLWLAILREPAALDELMAVLVTPVPRIRLLEAIESLHRCSLIERGQLGGSFILQSVILEYLTSRLIEEASDEIRSGGLARLVEHSLELAHAKDYIRKNQERLLITPILAHLRSTYRQQAALEKQLLALLTQLTAWGEDTQGYAPANVVTLLRSLRGSLRGLDLSRLVLRGVYLQGVEMQDATLSDALIQDSVFTETFDAILGVAISKNGDFWAASSRSGEIRVWTAGGLTLHRVWQAHADMVWVLAFSPDGRILASGSWDGMVKVWETASGALLWSGRHGSHVNSVAFSPDGSVLATGSGDATVRLWDANSGGLLQTLTHPAPVSVVTWSPDERLLVSGDMVGDIRLWDIQTEPKSSPALLAQTLTGHSNFVDGLAFSPDSSTMASGSWDNTVMLWDVASGNLLRTLTAHTDRVIRVAWSPDGHTLASSSRDQTIWLWDVEQGSYRVSLTGHTDGVCGLAFTPDSRSLLSSGDGTMRLWDVANGQSTRVMQGYTAFLYDVDWSPDGTQLISGGSDYLVTIYDVDGATAPRMLHGHGGVVCGVGWSPDGQWLASSQWDNVIRLWNPPSGDCLQIIQHPDDPGNFFYGLAWSPDGQRLASGTNRHGAQVFKAGEHRPLWDIPSFPTWIRRVSWSPDGAQLAGGGDDGSVCIWSAADGTLAEELAGQQGAVKMVVWNPDGRRLASGGSELVIWDTQTCERLHSLAGHPGIVYALAWSPRGDLLISGGSDGTLRWWDAQTGDPLWARQAHQGTVQSLRSSPDGTKLASCGDDGAILIWTLESGEYVQTLRRDRPYERLNITGVRGLTTAQKATLRALGAIELGAE